MKWNKKLEVMRHYDRSAPVYDAQYAEEQNAKIKALLNNLNINKNSLILDVGCGTGLLFEHIGKQAKRLIGLDISSKILKEAKKRVKLFPKVVIIRADADYAPFPNEIFDAVFAITIIQNIPNPILTLYEMKRISKKDAAIAVTGLKKEFSQEKFIGLLKEAGLEISIMKINDCLKGYVAICKKLN